jgi:hypothetical protein
MQRVIGATIALATIVAVARADNEVPMTSYQLRFGQLCRALVEAKFPLPRGEEWPGSGDYGQRRLTAWSACFNGEVHAAPAHGP